MEQPHHALYVRARDIWAEEDVHVRMANAFVRCSHVHSEADFKGAMWPSDVISKSAIESRLE